MELRNVPMRFRWKLGLYDVRINCDNVKSATLHQICHRRLEEDFQKKCISEMKSGFPDNIPVVGVYFKQAASTRGLYLLLLCVKDLCVFTEIDFDQNIPNELYDFFRDESICFVGFDKDTYRQRRELDFIGGYDRGNVTARIVEIRELAAAVLKKKSVAKSGKLADLGNAVGYKMKEADEVVIMDIPSDSKAKKFTEEEVKHAFSRAYHCYHIGKKLLTMI